jgi:hypothetical protein
MNNRTFTPKFLRALLLMAAVCLWAAPAAYAQGGVTNGGTAIKNRAAATYSDGTNTYATVSNEVTVTVANVSGLVITPDGGSVPTVVAGQQNVDFTFTVTNASNFPTQVRFLASGASVQFDSSKVSLVSAVIDTEGNGFGGVDTPISGNGADVLSSVLARNASFNVIVRVNILSTVSGGDAISVSLGDTPGAGNGDNAAANNSAAEVRTSTPTGTPAPVNGESEARGSISTTVENDAQLRVSLAVPAGPVTLGSNINYTLRLENTGARAAKPQTVNGPAGSNTGVFVVVPIPAGTVFQSFAALPAGVTVLYSTSALGVDPVGAADPPASGPLSASVVWQTTPPAPLSSITRVAFNVTGNANFASGADVQNLGLVLQVQSNINASNPIYGIGEAFARNNVNAPITDQSDRPGGEVSNKGDRNANFNEPRSDADPVSATRGFKQPTTLVAVGSVLIGTQGFPAASGPSGSTNDDYTNKSVAAAVFAGVAPGGNVGSFTVDFVNTVKNNGNADDTFTLTAPTVPAGFTVRISTDGTNFTTVSGGGSTTLALAFGAQANITVRVISPATSAVLTGFTTVIRAQSGNTTAETNDTIDRLYTGFLRLDKVAEVFNETTVGNGTDDPGTDDAVSGADIEYRITYTNIATSGDASNPNGGTNCVKLTITSLTIDEDGSVAPNNWAANTTQVLGLTPPSDNHGGTITDGSGNPVVVGTTYLKDTVTNLLQGDSGLFKFRRRIN